MKAYTFCCLLLFTFLTNLHPKTVASIILHAEGESENIRYIIQQSTNKCKIIKKEMNHTISPISISNESCEKTKQKILNLLKHTYNKNNKRACDLMLSVELNKKEKKTICLSENPIADRLYSKIAFNIEVLLMQK